MTESQKELLVLAHTKMPFGKYKDRYLIDLPEFYVVWFKNNGFPAGKLGQQLQLVYELKLNGLEPMLRDLRSRFQKP